MKGEDKMKKKRKINKTSENKKQDKQINKKLGVI